MERNSSSWKGSTNVRWLYLQGRTEENCRKNVRATFTHFVIIPLITRRISSFTTTSFRLDNGEVTGIEEEGGGVKAMLNQFTAWEHDKGTVRTGAENVLKPEVNGLGWRMEFTHPGRHERKVERFIRDMRNGIRTVVYSLPYHLPRKRNPDRKPTEKLGKTSFKKYSPFHLRISGLIH
jgi:hypothetical protein